MPHKNFADKIYDWPKGSRPKDARYWLNLVWLLAKNFFC
jgi:TolA-binding protein